jgi:hypothetical protein
MLIIVCFISFLNSEQVTDHIVDDRTNSTRKRKQLSFLEYEKICL